MTALDRGDLTLRGVDRVLRLAWTLADLAGARGRRQTLEVPEDTDAEGIEQVALTAGDGHDDAVPAQVVSMSEHLSAHRRARQGNHPAGTQLPAPEEADVTTRSSGAC